MKQRILIVSLAAVVLLIGGGFIFLSLTDVPVAAVRITKTIPNDRFFDAN